MLVDRFMEFLKEQDPPFSCGIHKGWFETDGGEISVDKLEKFLQKIYEQGKKDIFKDPWDKEFRKMVENYYKE